MDEVRNDITRLTPASFEPSIDYVVTKVPRWAFEKFPGVAPILSTRMQSVGEAMAIGRTFAESLQKALRSIELGRRGLGADPADKELDGVEADELVRRASVATPNRIFEVEAALRAGASVEDLYAATKIDPWFLHQIMRIVQEKEAWKGHEFVRGTASEIAEVFSKRDFLRAKRLGFSDAQLAYLLGVDQAELTAARKLVGVSTVFKTVDTCAAEFEAKTPYHYSSYDSESEVRTGAKPKVIILGSGPNRIGQGIEFDYCCVHASYALREAGYETIMVNCNPETVSTDYDTSDKLYLEPLFPEDLREVIEAETAGGAPLHGVIVSLGGQTPLKLAQSISPSLVLGTSPDSIDAAEDRKRWAALCDELRIPQPAGATVTSLPEALAAVSEIGYPVLVRPSYVLGGRAMEIVYDREELVDAFSRLERLSAEGEQAKDRPILIDSFLEDAIEVDVDAIRDAQGEFLLGGIMEHIEEAGIHSGDSACVIPPITLAADTIATLEAYTRAIADSLEVVGLINVQYAVKAGQVFVIEANPRASRTVPFVSKATAVPLVKIATLVMAGESIASLEARGVFERKEEAPYYSVKEAVLPFSRFPSADTLLGPEMRSTGEVMGIDRDFAMAFAKSQLGAGQNLPSEGNIFLSLADKDKPAGVELAKGLASLGFNLVATSGTADFLKLYGIGVANVVGKLGETKEGELDAVSLISSGSVGLVVNTPRGRGPRGDGYHIRTAANKFKVPCITTMSAALAAVRALGAMAAGDLVVKSIQEHHAESA